MFLPHWCCPCAHRCHNGTYRKITSLSFSTVETHLDQSLTKEHRQRRCSLAWFFTFNVCFHTFTVSTTNAVVVTRGIMNPKNQRGHKVHEDGLRGYVPRPGVGDFTFVLKNRNSFFLPSIIITLHISKEYVYFTGYLAYPLEPLYPPDW